MNKLIASLQIALILLNIGPASAAVTGPIDKAQIISSNLLVNGGFENGTYGWTASGGATKTANSTAKGTGTYGYDWDSNGASQTLTGTAYTIPVGLAGKNGVMSCNIKVPSGTATHTFGTYDGSTYVSYGTITSSSSFVRTTFNFVFGAAASTIAPRIVSVASNEPEIYVDDCIVADAALVNLSQVNQAQFVASGYIDTTASCSWTRSNTALGAFSTTAACPGPTVELNPGQGTLQTTDTDLPKFTMNSLPPGNYKVTIAGLGGPSGGATRTAYAVSDGTNTRGRGTGDDNAAGSVSQFTVEAWFSYSDSGNRTFELYGSSVSNSVAVYAATGNAQLRFSIERYPSLSELAYRPELYNWRVDASISGANPSLGTSAQTAYVGIEDTGLTLTNNTVTGSNVLTAQIPCSSTNSPSGTTCSVGSESVGVSYTQPIEGDVRACAAFSHQHNGASNQAVPTFQVVETAINAQTILQEGKDRISGGRSVAQTVDDTYPFRVCGTFHLTAGQKALRLMYEQPAAAGTNQILADASGTNGQRDIHWTVEPITQSVPAPLLVGSVTSNSSGQERIERATINCAAGGGITSQSGSWLSNWARGGAGFCTVTMSGFSATPICVTSEGASGGARYCGLASVTQTSFEVDHNSSGSLADGICNVICMGPR